MKRRFFPPRPPFPQKRKRILLYAEKSKPYPDPEDLSTEMTVWGMFLALLLICVCTTKFRLSSFPFMKTQWLTQRPLARCVVLLIELAVVASAFVFITLFSLFFTIIVTANRSPAFGSRRETCVICAPGSGLFPFVNRISE